MLRGDGGSQAASRLKILGPLGTGGFGAVYEATDLRSGQRVAVKELDDNSADSIARFKHEFRALADCHHDNLVGLKELIEQDGRWLIVMELVPGTDFLSYVRRAQNDNAQGAALPAYDEARLRKALAGMVEGLRALHRYGILHRDLKPSNVRVRPDGRAVLLDFGLATSVDPKRQSTHALGVGTVVYMAPEQAGGQSIGPAVDLYALGVCLFEALTGRAPFEGEHALQIVLEKQRVVAPRASSLAILVPPDLDELCAQLLAIDPALRPSPEQILSVLTEMPAPQPSLSREPRLSEEIFAGRDGELAHLERALARTHESELRVVLVEGESGVGKSELVSEFLRRVEVEHPELVTLRGRCYENEQVSYKAFDGCIDELQKFLRRMPEAECTALLPPRAVLLGQLFPVLRNVKAIAKAPRDGTSADPTARRLEAFAALSHLLGKLAEERPLVLVLDDLQWADSESFRLLTALSEQPVRAPILLLATVRPREELDTHVRTQLEEVRKWQHTDIVPLFGLPRGQAKALAKSLLPANTPEAWLDTIADESQGHPLFMSELIQYTASHDFASRGQLTLEAALRSRIDRLDRPARELLELVAVAARPYPSGVFADALSTQVEEPARALLASKLLRQRRGHELCCFHDRIRHAAVELIAKTRLPALHYQLGLALERLPGSDASEQARHWDLAAQPERASIAYEAAATNALDALAFSRAAQLCQRAIELVASPVDERLQRLTVQRANALACAGRSGEAAKLYQKAADNARGDARMVLRGRAAKYLMLSGKISEGFGAARKIMLELGFAVPLGVTSALFRYAWEMLRVRLQGIERARLPSAASLTAAELPALEIVRELMHTVAVVHPLAFAVVSIQHVQRAARAGSAAESASALTSLAWLRGLGGSLQTALPLLTRSKQMLEGETNPYIVAAQAYVAGSTLISCTDWPAASERLEFAQKLAQEKCPDNPWLLNNIRYHLSGVWYHLGEHARITSETDQWLTEARERNDTLAVALLVGMGYGFVRHLAKDAPELAILELEQVLAPLPSEPYSFAHFGVLIAMLYCLLYRGGPSALRFLDEYEAKHGHQFLLRSKTGQQATRIFRLHALLAAYVTDVAERPALLKQAKSAVRKVAALRSPLAKAMAMLSLSQIAGLEGRRAEALEHARDARTRFRQLRHNGERHALYVEGLLEGGDTGREKCESALAQFKQRGWENTQRAVAISAPLHALLAEAGATAIAPRTTLLLERYEVTGQLGSGGFGTVVSARDVRTGHVLALKELVASGGASLERFKQEFRALADVHHENVVQLEALFEHEGRWYIAMELVEGADLTSYLRERGACDPERLRSTFSGIARGLSALHEKGFVHRDVKSDNVMVTAEGRAVLIDFGLIARNGDGSESSPIGSVECAAPEQRLGAVPHPAADVYALGVALYVALIGRLPETRREASLLALKSEGAATETSARGELARLCAGMLSERPELRPTIDEVLAALSHERESAHGTSMSSAPRALDDPRLELAFIGREGEHDRLHAAFQRSTHELTFSLIEGESGLGKSALVNDFATRMLRRSNNLQLVRSRCYENEQVAFKAFDGAVDQLAQLLRALPKVECEALLPRRAALLGQLFPVLATVPAIAAASKKGLPADPAARKQAGRECFVELLEHLSIRAPMLWIVDDLQWADGDSFDLMRMLANRAKELPLLMVCTVRSASELSPEVARQIALLRALAGCESLSLGPLDSEATLSLLRQLLPGDTEDARLAALARESKGHPLFLRELVEQQKSGFSAQRGALTLDAALSKRIDGLPPEARELLALVAMADKPYGAQIYARALGRPELPRDALVALLAQGLIRRSEDKLHCYHDHIRRVMVARFAPEQRAKVARQLAEALSRDRRVDAAERARLWDEAGDVPQALEAYEQAGEQALEGLAFARAEQHYGRALSLLGEPIAAHVSLREPHKDDATWRRLLVGRAHALVRAGRSAEAAPLFQRAAESAQGEEKVRLRLWAAQHLIQSAQVEEGLSAAGQLLGELGLSLPATERAAKLRFAWERTRVKLRGIQLRTRQTSPEQRLVLEALHGLSSPVRAISLLPGSTLTMQYLRRALDAGDPSHAARALAYEALWRSIQTIELSQTALFDQSRTLAEATSDPALIAEIELMQGLACTAQGKMRQAPTFLWRAHELLSSQCPGQPWLLTASRMYLGQTWLHSGNFAELRRHMLGWQEEARARDDRYAVAALAGFGAGSFCRLLDDDVEGALAELSAAMAPWPNEPFTTNHFGAFVASSYMLASCEDGPRYTQKLREQSAQLERAFVMRAPIPRVSLLSSRVQALLQGIESPAAPGAQATLAEARAAQRACKRVPGAHAKAQAYNCEAWIQLVSGDREGAARLMRCAVQAADGIEHLYVSGMRFTLGALEGGESGRQLCAEVEEQIGAEGFRSGRRGLALRVLGNLKLLGLP